MCFVAHNGLCNRLGGVGGLWALAECLGATFEVHWSSEVACPCAFEDIWDAAEGLTLADEARVDALRERPDAWVCEDKKFSHFWAAPWLSLVRRFDATPDFAAYDDLCRRCLGRLRPSAAVVKKVHQVLELGPWCHLDLGDAVGAQGQLQEHARPSSPRSDCGALASALPKQRRPESTRVRSLFRANASCVDHPAGPPEELAVQ